jgi:hypothetical protein
MRAIPRGTAAFEIEEEAAERIAPPLCQAWRPRRIAQEARGKTACRERVAPPEGWQAGWPQVRP